MVFLGFFSACLIFLLEEDMLPASIGIFLSLA